MALISAPSTTAAVPSWSFCITGMLSRSRSFATMSKQAGAATSSTWMPLYVGATRTTASTNSSAFEASMRSGAPFTPANCWRSAALPSMTGIPAARPMFPRPSTAVPSVTIATVLPMDVKRRASFGCA